MKKNGGESLCIQFSPSYNAVIPSRIQPPGNNRHNQSTNGNHADGPI